MVPRRAGLVLFIFLIVWVVAVVTGVEASDGSAQPDLWVLCRTLHQCCFVDLAHSFHEKIPHWKGFPSMRVRDTHTYEWDGFWAQEFTHVGQWGTHVDPPAHFHKGLRTVDTISLEEMVLPLVVVDVHEKVERDPDYMLTLDDIRDWETRNGRIPERSFVALRTDWSERWPDPDAMANLDDNGVAHYPGWSLEALRFLYETRGITASGHETTDTDPGIKTSAGNYEAEAYILGRNRYQIELLANLDTLPEKGALVICTFPKPRHGSGFPARVFAIVP